MYPKTRFLKLKEAHKNAKKWTKTFIFQTRIFTQSWRNDVLEMMSYLRGKLFSGCSPMIFRFFVKFWWRKEYYWKTKIKFQWNYKSNQTISQKCPFNLCTSLVFIVMGTTSPRQQYIYPSGRTIFCNVHKTFLWRLGGHR